MCPTNGVIIIFIQSDSDVASCRRLINLFEDFPALLHIDIDIPEKMLSRIVLLKSISCEENDSRTRAANTHTHTKKVKKKISSQ